MSVDHFLSINSSRNQYFAQLGSTNLVWLGNVSFVKNSFQKPVELAVPVLVATQSKPRAESCALITLLPLMDCPLTKSQQRTTEVPHTLPEMTSSEEEG